MADAIHTTMLTRRYANGSGVSELNLCVPEASIYAFLGANGSGKTTTIRLLVGLLRAQRGSVEFFGQPAQPGRAHIASLVESPSLYPHLSGRENLEITRRLLGLKPASIDRALNLLGLEDAAARKVREYSLGMRQRLALALALLGQPRLLILDEPANGLDPAANVELRTLLRTLCMEEGISVFLSSHLLSEVEQIASHVGVLHQGRLCFQGELSELRARAKPCLHLQAEPCERVALELDRMGVQFEPFANGLRLAPSPWTSAEINAHLVHAGIAVHAIGAETVTLEDLYFGLTESVREAA